MGSVLRQTALVFCQWELHPTECQAGRHKSIALPVAEGNTAFNRVARIHAMRGAFAPHGTTQV